MIRSKHIQRPQLVLVVDDQEINRDALGIILEDNYEILYADDSLSVNQLDDSGAANAIETFLSSMDSEKFLDGKTAFLTFTRNLLVKNIVFAFTIMSANLSMKQMRIFSLNICNRNIVLFADADSLFI